MNKKNTDWASPAQVSILDSIMGNHTIACGRLPTMRPLARTVEDISLVAVVEVICDNVEEGIILFEKVFVWVRIIHLG